MGFQYGAFQGFQFQGMGNLMADVLDTLVWKLKHLVTPTEVHVAPKPVGAKVPCLTVQIIDDPMQDNNDQSGASLHRSRVQIGHIGTAEEARTLVQTVQTYLEGNQTDFLSCISAGNYIPLPPEGKIHGIAKDYFIQWKY